MNSLPLAAQPVASDLLSQLAQAEDDETAQRIERRLVNLWSQSGSPSMDLLLTRGRDAIEKGQWRIAAGHLRALTDHAPEFAEGWQSLALALYNLDRYGPAMNALEHALALNPQHFGALRGVAAIHEQVGAPALAYQAYQQVLELRPHDSTAKEAIERLDREVKGRAL